MATMVDQNDRTKDVGEMHNIEGWTKYVYRTAVLRTVKGTELVSARFTFPGRGDKYSDMKWVRG